MTVLIVGADRLGNITQKLNKEGVNNIIHWTGRSKSFSKKAIPKNVERIIIFYDFLNHNLMHNVKRQAKENGIPIIYNKRALTECLGGLTGCKS